jgi:hypothetical protein
VLLASAMAPGSIDGVTSPNPIPYRVIPSPGFAGLAG